MASIPTLLVEFGTGSTFTAVSNDYVLKVNIRRGRTKLNTMLEAGTATVVLNNQSGLFDPSNTSSPWYSTLVAGMKVKISGNGIVIFSGFLETNLVNQGIYPTVSLIFVDGMANLGRVTAPALATSSYSETAAARAARVLDYASWSATARSLTGTVTMLASTFGISCLTLLRQCANVIGGRFYLSRTGVATLVPLADKFSRPTQLLFSDQGDANSVLYDGIVTNPGTDYVFNEAVVFRGSGQTQVTAKYSPSVTTYGVKTKTLDAPTFTTSQATNLAYYAARKDADVTVFIERVDFNAINLGTLATDFLETELYDLVSVKRQTYDGRYLAINGVVEGINHDIEPSVWRASFFTSAINPYTITI